MQEQDTICAISTPSGKGAVAIIRLSGENAFNITGSVFQPANEKKYLADQPANTIHFGSIINDSDTIDEVLISLFKAPHSYTGEDIIEISCHGSLYVQQKILELLIEKGARMARPGEFTLRAFLNGKLDLSQAEAVADLISSSSRSAHKVAVKQMRGGFSLEIKKLRDQLLNFISLIELELDFSEEDVEFADRKAFKKLVKNIESLLSQLIQSFTYGNVIKNGIPVAIVGQTNAGKSTLLNLILKEEKAIVSEIAGTTRDAIEDTIVLDGIQYRFIDTAGLRETTDTIESMGIERTYNKLRQASIVILMIDIRNQLEDILGDISDIRKHMDAEEKHLIVVLNKADMIDDPEETEELVTGLKEIVPADVPLIQLSAMLGTNIESLTDELKNAVNDSEYDENDVIVSNVRHFEALKHAHEAITRVNEGIDASIPGDLLAVDLRECLHYLGEITGEITTDEILGNIFKNFCIGK